jgi:hypothetical protein
MAILIERPANTNVINQHVTVFGVVDSSWTPLLPRLPERFDLHSVCRAPRFGEHRSLVIVIGAAVGEIITSSRYFEDIVELPSKTDM